MRRESGNNHENERSPLKHSTSGVDDSDDEEESYIYSRGHLSTQPRRNLISPIPADSNHPAAMQFGSTTMPDSTSHNPYMYSAISPPSYGQHLAPPSSHHESGHRQSMGQSGGGLKFKSLSQDSVTVTAQASRYNAQQQPSSQLGAPVPSSATAPSSGGTNSILVNSPAPDMHHFYPMVRTLSTPDLHAHLKGDPQTAKAKDTRLVKTNIRWKTACGFSTFLNAVLLVFILTSLVYWLFFREPTIFIDQVQISHIPIADTDLGFNVRFQVDNPSLLNATITSCYLSVVIVDPSSSTEYDIPPSIEMNTSHSVQNIGTTYFNIASTISIAKNPYFLQISKLVTLGRFGVRLSGHMGYTTASFGHTAPLFKYQQLYTSNIHS